MKLHIIVLKKLPAAGMAVFPFILIKEEKMKSNIRLIKHECIHFRQQLELLIIPFYILYLFFFIIKWIQLRNREEAYLAIPFEKEAYACENEKGYLNSRKFFAWCKHL